MIASTRDYQQFFALAFSVSSVAWTISRAWVFLKFRDWVGERSEWFHHLVGCPYCLGHWLSFAAVLVYRSFIVHFFWLTDYLVTSMAMVTIAMVGVGIITWGLSVGVSD